jgi:hypothetical protein
MNLTPEVKACLAKARYALEVAEKIQLGGDFPDAAGKAYYAMFYAARALRRTGRCKKKNCWPGFQLTLKFIWFIRLKRTWSREGPGF